MAEDGWFYESKGERVGPVTLAALKDLIAQGTVVQTTRVWAKGMNDWVPAGTVAVLYEQKPDLGMRMLLPVGRSGFAIAAGYLGLFSFFPFVGILALIFSTVALLDIRKHPEKTGMGRVITGYVLGGLSTVLYAVAFLKR